ncbi:cytochrome P450 [Talaromyces proteolyticus]|uniref:Cytochrome P450 n=1 Tax=Talaromyces proteolyticus TaxID=1131652 RepID=A0AAD4KDM9_9EURO|nr:cytochrome P450 [Talaromyces proteolyticus]KAH8689317.1 cytochrome P450 [Talaromyces proteolyticus]
MRITSVHIPAGTRTITVPWAINRSQDLWGPDAESFVPSHWIDKKNGNPNNTGAAKSNYSILTFFHGWWSCIGQDFAKGVLRVLVAAFMVSGSGLCACAVWSGHREAEGWNTFKA